MAIIDEKKEELQLLKEAKKDILSGRVQKFHKGDTSYTMLNFKDLCECIANLETEIKVLEAKTEGAVCRY